MKLKNLIRYTFFWCGMPESKKIYEGDVMLAQAFGRNSFTETDLKILNEKFNEFESDEKILEWIRTKNFDPGKPNKEIADGIMDYMQRRYIPAIVQWEIAVAFPSDWYERNKKYITCIWPPEESKYFDTRSVVIASLKAMEEKKLSHPIVAAHKMQIVRVACMVKKLSGKFPFVSEVQPKSFDRNSLQWWTRNIFFWLLREFFVRIHHIIKRYV